MDFLTIFAEFPLNAVNAAAAFQAKLSLVVGAVLPGFILGIEIIFGDSSPAPFDTKQHPPDKGVKSGFSRFIFSVNNIEAVLKIHGFSVKFSKAVYMQIKQFHDWLLSSVV